MNDHSEETPRLPQSTGQDASEPLLLLNSIEQCPGNKPVPFISKSAALPSSNGHSSRVEPLTLSWHNLTASAQRVQRNWCLRRGKKNQVVEILKNVSGDARPGQLLGILGSSGAGKTTLLDVLTGRRVNKLSVKGCVEVNGVSMGKSIASVLGYAQQEDVFLGTLTVREHLTFQAWVRMAKSHTKKQRRARVEEVISELGLTKCADTLIGIPGRIRGISGGERKRLSFASELLTNRSLIFCDEPTSGLDSYMARSVMSVLQQLAAAGRTVVCSIHQPSSDIYGMFNRILYLMEGRVAYLGDLPGAINFFSRHDLICPNNYNPADYFIEKLSVVPGREDECKKRIQEICDSFEQRQHGQEMINIKIAQATDDIWSEDATSSRMQALLCIQTQALFWRSFIGTFREPLVTTVRIAQTIALSVVMGLLYWQQEPKHIESIMNYSGMLFITLACLTFQNMFYAINVFCSELPVFLREYSNGLYRADIYFISKTLTELPFYIFIAIITGTISYWMVGLHNSAESFFIFLATLILVSVTSCSFGYFISCCVKDVNMAITLSSPIIAPLMFFGGYFLNIKTVPLYLTWLKYTSWLYYAYEILSVNHWEKVDCIGEPPFCIQSGEDILQATGFHASNLVLDFIILVVLVFAYRLLAYVALIIRARNLK